LIVGRFWRGIRFEARRKHWNCKCARVFPSKSIIELFATIKRTESLKKRLLTWKWYWWLYKNSRNWVWRRKPKARFNRIVFIWLNYLNKKNPLNVILIRFAVKSRRITKGIRSIKRRLVFKTSFWSFWRRWKRIKQWCASFKLPNVKYKVFWLEK